VQRQWQADFRVPWQVAHTYGKRVCPLCSTVPAHLCIQQPRAQLYCAVHKHLNGHRGGGARQAEAVGKLLPPVAATCGVATHTSAWQAHASMHRGRRGSARSPSMLQQHKQRAWCATAVCCSCGRST
jgi:hypothetical protein